ncbi:unnamed protein product, partial [Schistosoma margrebowiei]
MFQIYYENSIHFLKIHRSMYPFKCTNHYSIRSYRHECYSLSKCFRRKEKKCLNLFNYA